MPRTHVSRGATAVPARMIALLAVLPAAVALTGCGGTTHATAPLDGTYAANVHESTQGTFNGHWAMTFSKNNALSVSWNGTRFDTGKVSFDKNVVTFVSDRGGLHACPTPGRYRWSLAGQTLHFRLISDTCPGRVITLAIPFRKQG
jgi:hypothetical protein